MKPLLSVPTRGMISWATVTRLEEIRDSLPGCPPIIYQAGNLSVAQTRNRIVRRFFQTDCDVLVMVDDDIVPSPHWLNEVEQAIVGHGYGMVALPHPMPDPRDPSRLRLTVFSWTPDGWDFADLETGLNPCDAAATGCFAISRQALETLGPDPFRISDVPDGRSDDYWLCRDLAAHGIKIGYWYDGWFADHHSTVSLAPLMEVALVR